MAAEGSRKVVIAALAGNVAIAVCKFGAAIVSGSTATLAAAVHSVADSGNQGLLLLGIYLASRPATPRYPFGRASERYFWPFVVALILFSLGGAFAIYEGVHHLLEGVDAITIIDHTVMGVHLHFSSNVVNYVVLGTSFFFEAMSFRVAFREFRETTHGKPILKAFFEARDPTVPLVLAEDTTALFGLGLALAAVVLRATTGLAFFDPLGSVLIGVLLACVAIMLASVTHGLLIGKTVTDEDRAKVVEIAQGVPGVERVTQLLGIHLGPDVVVLALKVAFTPKTTVEIVEETTNEMERRLRKELPHMKKIFIEPDSHGDGRGLLDQNETP
ncbi:MAG TPA: cation diffusion facilitator family transporter [Polyangiaceae bacterium]|nr:cation diffusion facilitator family transporter [Polyangiaceae bacterium]